MNKKVAVILITVLILGGCFSSAWSGIAYADSGSAASLLSAMGIIGEENTNGADLSKTLTRAEYAKMLVMASAYKDLVAQSSRTSVFKDVPYTHWAASYIKIAAANDLLSGYSDGTFRPDSGITYEQALYGALKQLGYTRENFTGGTFPDPQINLGISIGLTAGVKGSAGSTMTKQDGINLIYNLLTCDISDGTMTYAEKIGYSVNDNGQIDYASALAANMNGPVTVRSLDWYSNLGLTTAATIYRKGSLASLADVEIYDVAYYSASSNTAWVYSDKISGIYEKAEPNQDAPTSIVVSGGTYEIGSSAAFSALSSVGDLKPGNTITLLLDKDGKIADAVSGTELSANVIIYVTGTGTKVYQNSDGNDYTADYFSGVTPNGTEIEYAALASWVKVGDIISVGVDDDSLELKKESSGRNLYGKVDPSLMQIGSAKLAANVSILDTYKGSYATVSAQRLAGLTLTASDVLYYKAEAGVITQVILANVSGDAADYGMILSAKSNSSGLSQSGSYTYMIDGVKSTVTTENMTYNVSKGAAAFFDSGGELIGMRNISALTRSGFLTMTATSVTSGGTVYPFADDVSVYLASGSSYITTNVNAAIAAKAAGKSLRFYYDQLPQYGGRIRIIIIQD